MCRLRKEPQLAEDEPAMFRFTVRYLRYAPTALFAVGFGKSPN
jgi:hypothetical protein